MWLSRLRSRETVSALLGTDADLLVLPCGIAQTPAHRKGRRRWWQRYFCDHILRLHQSSWSPLLLLASRRPPAGGLPCTAYA